MFHVNLSGTTVLLTGASNGIGKSTADFLMRMGATVAVHYHTNKRTALDLIEQYPETNSKIFKADLSNESEIYQLFESVINAFTRIDTIILNAANFLPHSTQKNSEEWYTTWKKTIEVNLNAVGLLTKLGIDHFINNKEGRFIFLSSRAAFRGETEEYLAYAASKGGVTSLAKSVARSFGKQNIKSFIIAPGFTKTQMADSFIATHGEEKVLKEIALNHLTRPEDITPLIGMMCSGLLDHTTGATIDINAGSHIR